MFFNPGGGKGGICFGDSGGPALLGGTDRVLDYASRIDIPEVLEWIQRFL